MTNRMRTSAGDAVISDDGVYRYRLTRRWREDVTAGDTITWVMLNPSTADAAQDDPTIRRLRGFSESWGYGGFVVVNLFALRSSDPRAMVGHPDPVGADNLRWLNKCLAESDVTIAAWGTKFPRALRGHVDDVAGRLSTSSKVRVLGLTKGGHPRHPLYVAGTAPAVAWRQ